MRRSITAAAAAFLLLSLRPASAGACPSAVTHAALEAHAGAKITSCKKEQEDGKLQYEVLLTTYHGRKLELDLTPEGKILVTEAQIEPQDVPQVVMTAFHAKYADVKPTRAEQQTAADGSVTYELKFAGAAKAKEATFTAGGLFVEEE